MHVALGEEQHTALQAEGGARRMGLEQALRRAAGAGEELHMAEATAARKALAEEDIGPAAAETGSILPVEAEREDTGRIALLGAAQIGPAEEDTVPAEEDIDHVEEDIGPVGADTGPAGEDIGLEEAGTGRSPREAAVLRCVRVRSRCEAAFRRGFFECLIVCRNRPSRRWYLRP